MSNFTEPLILNYRPLSNLWRTEREFKYFVGDEESKDCVTVPKYFFTDLASIPWPASMLIPKSGKFNQGAVLHDFLYSLLGEVVEPYNLKKRTRAECDLIFKEAMRVLGVNGFKIILMFQAVRRFGFIPWNIHKRKLEKQNKEEA